MDPQIASSASARSISLTQVWRLPRGAVALSGLIAGAFLLLFFIFPVVRLGWVFFQSGMSRTTWDDLLPVIRATLGQASVSTALASTVGLGLGCGLQGLLLPCSEKVRRLVLGMLQIPFVLPTIVVVQIALFWVGHSGWLTKILGWSPGYSFNTVIGVHVFLNAPWISMLVAHAGLEIPRSQWEAARTLGARPWTRFWYIAWPYLRSPWMYGLVQVFSLCVTSFTVVLLLGGGPPVETLETVIYTKIRYAEVDLPGAVLAAFIQMGLTLPLMILSARWRRTAILPVQVNLSSRGFGDRGFRRLSRNLILLLLLIPIAGAGAPIFIRSLGGFFRFEDSSQLTAAFVQSLGLAVSVVVSSAILSVAVVLFGVKLRLRGMRTAAEYWWNIFLIPSGLSVLMICLGTWLTYERWVDPFASGFWFIVGVQTLLFLPFLIRTILPLLGRTQVRALEAARTLGANSVQAFWIVEWPRWRGVWVRGLGLVGALSFGEFAAVSFFSTGEWLTLPVLQGQLLSRYRFADAELIAGVLWAISVGIWGLGLWKKRG